MSLKLHFTFQGPNRTHCPSSCSPVGIRTRCAYCDALSSDNGSAESPLTVVRISTDGYSTYGGCPVYVCRTLLYHYRTFDRVYGDSVSLDYGYDTYTSD